MQLLCSNFKIQQLAIICRLHTITSIIKYVKYFPLKVPVRAAFHTVQVFVAACSNGNIDTGDHGVDIKILKDKKLIQSFEDVHRPQLIRFNGTQPGERFIIRVMDTKDTSSSKSGSHIIDYQENGGGLSNWPVITTNAFSDTVTGNGRVEVMIK